MLTLTKTMLVLALRGLPGAQTRSRQIGHCRVNDGMLEPGAGACGRSEAARLRDAALTSDAFAALTGQAGVGVLRQFSPIAG